MHYSSSRTVLKNLAIRYLKGISKVMTLNEENSWDSDVPYIVSTGTYHEIGYKHGTLAKDRIKRNLVTYQKLFKDTAHISWAEANDRAAKYVPFLKNEWPDILDEIEGIAEGSDVPIEDIITLNVRSEIALTNYSDGCSAVAQVNSDSNEVFISQNWDWVEELRWGLILLDIKPNDRPRIITMTEAGIVGKIGFNECGLGLMLNAINCGLSQVALPVHLSNRKCLESRSVDEAISELKKFGVASTSNFMLADKSGKILSLESSPNGFSIIDRDDDNAVLHTNHLLAEHRCVKDYPSSDSFVRLKRLGELTKGSVATIQNIRKRLSDEKNYPYSLSRGYPQNAKGIEAMVTNATIILNLTEGIGEISFGRPSNNPKVFQLYFS